MFQRLSVYFLQPHNRDRHHNTNFTSCVTSSVWLGVSLVLVVISKLSCIFLSDHHLGAFERVFRSCPTFPTHSELFLSLTVPVFAIQVGSAAILVPPAAAFFLVTDFYFSVDAIACFLEGTLCGTEIHPDVVRQRVTFKQCTTRKHRFISPTAQIPHYLV